MKEVDEDDRPAGARRPWSGWGFAGIGTLAVGVFVILIGIVVRGEVPGTPFLGGEPESPGMYADAWREVEPSPLSARAGARALWTGEEVLVLGGVPDGVCWDCDLAEGLHDAAAYDPATDRWRPLADVPIDVLHWNTSVTASGEHLLARVLRHQESRLLVYDVATDAWTELPAPDLLGLELVGDGYRVLTVRRCTCPRHPPQEQVLDLSSGEWSDLPPDPFPESTAVHIEVVDRAIYRFAPDPARNSENIDVAVLRPGADDWEVLDPDGLPGWTGETDVVGNLIVATDQPFAIDTDDTFPPLTWAFDTGTEDWVTLPRLTEPMESGLTASDGDTLWFGDVVLDGSTRSWSPGEYRPETASDASTVWIGDRWFAFGGQTDLGMTQRAFTWAPEA